MLTLLIVIVAMSASSQSTEASSKPSQNILTQGGDDVIAVIDLSGPIVDEETSSDPLSFSSNVISSRQVKSVLKDLKEDDKVKAIVIRLNSPGGGVVASDELYRSILSVKEKKPVVFSFGDVAASGGYYIAAAGNKIVANPATITGSIGVIAQFPELTGLYEKVGVKMTTFKSGEFKDIGSTDRPVTESETQIMQSIITDSYDQFISAIVNGRNMDEANVRQLADGRIYSGIQAKQNGLIDELGTVETAIEIAKELSKVEDPSVIEYSEGGFWESLLQSQAQRLQPFSALNQLLPLQKSGVYYLMSI